MYDSTLGQNGHFSKKTNQKNHVSFMPHTLNQSEHPFGQCEHINQVEPLKNHDFL
jgi:hypothetical protein